ncbi:hypothetical protein ACMFMF_007426 [Clarireedia jacksonii]
MEESLPTLALKSSTILNRLGKTILVSAFVNKDHFFTIRPGADALCHSLDIKWFLIQFPNGERACFAPPDNIIINTGSVISLKLSENGPIILHFPAESPGERLEIPLQNIEVPIIADPVAEITTNSLAHQFFNKLVSLANYPQVTRGVQFPVAAMDELFDAVTAREDPGPIGLDNAPTARNLMLSATPMMMTASSPVSLSSAATTATPAPPKAGSEDMNKLMELLSDSGKPPQQQVSEGRAPKVPITNVKPAEGNQEALQCYQDIKLVTGLASLFQEILRVQRMTAEGRKGPYGITDPVEANLAMKENADVAYQVMHGGLGGYYDNINMYSRSYKKTVSHKDIKIEFTSEIFKPFGFTKPALEEISGFLEQYISAIAKIKTDTSSTEFRNAFSKQIHQVLRLNVGTEENPVLVWQPKARLVYMHIDSQSYKETVKTCLKEETTESYMFSMDYVIVEADINTQNVERRREKLTKAFDIVSDKNIDAFISQAGVAHEVTDTTPNVDGM